MNRFIGLILVAPLLAAAEDIPPDLTHLFQQMGNVSNSTKTYSYSSGTNITSSHSSMRIQRFESDFSTAGFFKEFSGRSAGLSLDDRIRKAEYYIRDKCPSLENRIDFVVRDVSAKRAVEIVQEKLGVEFPVECDAQATVGYLKMQNVPALEIIESIASSAELNVIYTPDIIYLSPIAESQ